MPEPDSIPQLLQTARLERGMDLTTLARKTGVARNHLIDIESGSGRSFHTLVYCRKAVDMVAREFGLEDQVAKAWRDEDWMVSSGGGSRLASMEVSPPTLLPSIDSGQHGPSRKWRAPLVGLVGLAFVGWLAISRIDQEPESPAMAGAPTKGTDSNPTTPVSPPSLPVASAPAVPTPSPAVGPGGVVTPKPASTLRNQAEATMHEWVKLWRTRQVEAYAALYDPRFVGLDRHLGIRRQRMTQASFIEVEISELQSRETAPGEVTVGFRQVYRSDNYQSDDRKEMIWRQTPQGLKIIAERLVN